MGYGEVLATLFSELEPMRRFQEQFYVYTMPTLSTLLESLMRGYGEWAARNSRRSRLPTGRMCRPSMSTKSAVSILESGGVRTILVDPRALEYHDGICGRAIFA